MAGRRPAATASAGRKRTALAAPSDRAVRRRPGVAIGPLGARASRPAGSGDGRRTGGSSAAVKTPSTRPAADTAARLFATAGSAGAVRMGRAQDERGVRQDPSVRMSGPVIRPAAVGGRRRFLLRGHDWLIKHPACCPSSPACRGGYYRKGETARRQQSNRAAIGHCNAAEQRCRRYKFHHQDTKGTRFIMSGDFAPEGPPLCLGVLVVPPSRQSDSIVLV